MKKVAITGNYAVGKSYIISLLNQEFDYPVFLSDEFVKNLYEDQSVQKKIIAGVNKLTSFNKKQLADLIYSDKISRKQIEDIVHPLVMDGVVEFAKKNNDAKLVFFEVPLLFEAGLEKEFDISLCVYCSEDVRIRRASARLNYDQETFEKITNIQMPQGKKRELADYVINSDQDEVILKKNITQLISKILKIS